MSVHDETWDRPICEFCREKIPYGKTPQHKLGACLIPKGKYYKLNLIWEPDEHGYYNSETYCLIWDKQVLAVTNNGENFYNVELYDKHGNEEEGIAGGETIETAKIEAENWVTERLKRFMTEV